MFSANHFIWLGICAAIIGILLFISLKWKIRKKTAILIMVGFSIASELLKMFTRIHDVVEDGEVVGGVLSPSALPLHLCSIFIFVFFYLAIQKNEEREKKIISFFVPIGLLGAFSAILIATSGVARSWAVAFMKSSRAFAYSTKYLAPTNVAANRTKRKSGTKR